MRLAARRRVLYAEHYGERHRELEKLRIERAPLVAQAGRLAAGIRERSKELGFNRPREVAKKEFFVEWLIRQPSCECCGVKFSIGFKSGIVRDDAPSIDRFDASRGYALDNIALICWRCNNIKRNYRSSDLRTVAAWMDAWGNQTDKFRRAEAAE
jgi:5-methylcytosine-specific restriction endonuclease McrA